MDGDGTSLLFLRDTGGKSTCYEERAEAWPPLLTQNENIKAGQGVHSNMLGTVKRTDGAMQVTYGGHPLYYYEDDTKPGMLKGRIKKSMELNGTWLNQRQENG